MQPSTDEWQMTVTVTARHIYASVAYAIVTLSVRPSVRLSAIQTCGLVNVVPLSLFDIHVTFKFSHTKHFSEIP